MKITFMGAGSTVFARNVLGDCMCTPALCEAEIALYDINEERLKDSEIILGAINKNVNESSFSSNFSTYLYAVAQTYGTDLCVSLHIAGQHRHRVSVVQKQGVRRNCWKNWAWKTNWKAEEN